MRTSNLSIVELGPVSIRHHFDFDALVMEARRAGVDTHPNVIADNWATERQQAVHIAALSVGMSTKGSIDSVCKALDAEGLRPCTPHEALCIAIDCQRHILSSERYHVAVARVWQAKDGPAVLTAWNSLGHVRVGTVGADTTWHDDRWRFLATLAG